MHIQSSVDTLENNAKAIVYHAEVLQTSADGIAAGSCDYEDNQFGQIVVNKVNNELQSIAKSMNENIGQAVSGANEVLDTAEMPEAFRKIQTLLSEQGSDYVVSYSTI